MIERSSSSPTEYTTSYGLRIRLPMCPRASSMCFLIYPTQSLLIQNTTCLHDKTTSLSLIRNSSRYTHETELTRAKNNRMASVHLTAGTNIESSRFTNHTSSCINVSVVIDEQRPLIFVCNIEHFITFKKINLCSYVRKTV
jgi:hypothetical protein